MAYKYELLNGVSKVKTKLAITFSALGVGAAGVFGAASILGTAHATSTPVTVTTANSQGWTVVQDNSGTTGGGSFVTGPAAPPLGAGSAELYTNNSNDGYFLTDSLLGGTKLSDIHAMSYETYVQTGNNTIAPTLQFDVSQDVNDSSTYYGRLVYEPYQNAAVHDRTWQTWNAHDGKWWLSHAASQFGGICSQASPCTFSDLIDHYPNMGVRNLYGGVVGFKAGSGWTTPFVGNVDAFSVTVGSDTTVYNFEKAVATGSITSPVAGSYNRGSISLAATYEDGDTTNTDDGVQWAVRSGTSCAAGSGTVAGNVDGHNDTAAWNGNTFTYALNTTTLSDGSYCFVFNPSDDPGQPNVRETQNFYIDNTRPDVAFVSPADFSNPFNGGPVVTVSASDNLSGLQSLVIHVYDSSNNPAKFCTATSAELTDNQMSCDLSSLSDGTYYIKAGAFDKAGNNRTINSGSFVIMHALTTQDQCKNGGWETFSTLSFRNQGDCVSYVNHHDGNGADDQHAH
jgi:hypothetical protein